MNPIRSIDDVKIDMLVQVDLGGRHKPKRGRVTGKTETHALVKFEGKRPSVEIPVMIEYRRYKYEWKKAPSMMVVTAHDEWLERHPRGDVTTQYSNRGRDIVVNCAAFTSDPDETIRKIREVANWINSEPKEEE